MKKIYQYILLAVALVATASCSNELDDTLQPANSGTLQFVVSDFPMFGEGIQTRVIGTQDEGKTEWVNGDQIIVTLTSQKYGEQTAALTYDGISWSTEASLSYLENETPTVSAVYAPECKISENNIVLDDNQVYGMSEYIHAFTKIEGKTLRISFEGVERNYSRLRIAAMPKTTLTVTTTGFTPAGPEGASAPESYTLTTDDNGNGFLYGTFAEGATVNVKKGDITLKDYTFTAEKNPNGTEYNKSYALDARPVIDGTLGGKAEATDAEVEDLVQQLKDYVDSGITTIIVTGVEPALIDVSGIIMPAVSEAIYRLTDSGYYDENNPYNGKIDLILQDVTEIMNWEFYTAFALNSITLPKVTKLGDLAFYGTEFLRTITLGSVITEAEETGGVMFYRIGEKVGGCDLILNCGQMKESRVPTPDLTTNIWKLRFSNQFKSITLTHTGECDECKALQ